MPRPRHNTTFLPREIREELGLIDSYGVKKQKQNRQPLRKERRKAERREQKVTPKFKSGAASRRLNDDEHFSEGSRFGSEADSGRDSLTESKTEVQRPMPKSILKKANPPLEGTDLSSRGVTDKLSKDDAEIAALERKLGIKNKKSLPKSFHDDGLADILGEAGSGSEEEGRKRRREEGEWLQNKRRKALGSVSNEVEENVEDTDEDEDEIYNQDPSDDDYDDEFSGFASEDGETENGRLKSPPRTKENPYVAPVTSRDNSRPKYIPPSLRTRSSEETESQIRLQRQARGLLNKMSESNLISTLSEVEKLYREFPRQSVTSTLSSLLLGLFCDRSSLQDSFVILHAGFIAAIYKIIGMDFGADIIQKLVETFDQSGDGQGAFEGKESINLLSLLSQLYNFHVIGSSLVFDYIRLFLKEISEVNTEFLLKIIKSASQFFDFVSVIPFETMTFPNLVHRFRSSIEAG
jgi:nucleolar MIF4G domain-containing protein 1